MTPQASTVLIRRGAQHHQMPATPQRAPRLPLPEDATPIGEAAYLAVTQQGAAVYVWGTLWWSWQTGDQTARRLAAVQLALAKTAKRIDIAQAFGITPETIWRWCRDYTREGIDALRPAKTGPKGSMEAHRRGHQPHQQLGCQVLAPGDQDVAAASQDHLVAARAS